MLLLRVNRQPKQVEVQGKHFPSEESTECVLKPKPYKDPHQKNGIRNQPHNKIPITDSIEGEHTVQRDLHESRSNQSNLHEYFMPTNQEYKYVYQCLLLFKRVIILCGVVNIMICIYQFSDYRLSFEELGDDFYLEKTYSYHYQHLSDLECGEFAQFLCKLVTLFELYVVGCTKGLKVLKQFVFYCFKPSLFYLHVIALDSSLEVRRLYKVIVSYNQQFMSWGVESYHICKSSFPLYLHNRLEKESLLFNNLMIILVDDGMDCWLFLNILNLRINVILKDINSSEEVNIMVSGQVKMKLFIRTLNLECKHGISIDRFILFIEVQRLSLLFISLCLSWSCLCNIIFLIYYFFAIILCILFLSGCILGLSASKQQKTNKQYQQFVSVCAS